MAQWQGLWQKHGKLVLESPEPTQAGCSSAHLHGRQRGDFWSVGASQANAHPSKQGGKWEAALEGVL